MKGPSSTELPSKPNVPYPTTSDIQPHPLSKPKWSAGAQDGGEEGRDWGLHNLKLINLGSHLSQICNEGRGDEEERGHWTKAGGHKLVASGL